MNKKTGGLKTHCQDQFRTAGKSRNKGQKSKMFDTLTEVYHYHATYGGRVYAINGTEQDYNSKALTEEMRKLDGVGF